MKILIFVRKRFRFFVSRYWAYRLDYDTVRTLIAGGYCRRKSLHERFLLRTPLEKTSLSSHPITWSATWHTARVWLWRLEWLAESRSSPCLRQLLALCTVLDIVMVVLAWARLAMAHTRKKGLSSLSNSVRVCIPYIRSILNSIYTVHEPVYN